MPNYSTLGDYRFSNAADAADDIRGSAVYGSNDDKLGKVDDVIFDQASGAIVFLVVDTGGWLQSKKFIVPPDRLRPSLEHENDFRVELNKEQIESFPAYDSADVASEERWGDYEKRYRSHWVDGPVMHRAATDRNITPTTQQQVDAGSGSLPQASDDDTAELTPMRTDGTMDVSVSGPSMRWTTFEDKLRQRKEEVLSSSIRVAKEASGESAAARRKAS
jgi:sporulation protein YlmC with PRC-barrel domain